MDFCLLIVIWFIEEIGKEHWEAIQGQLVALVERAKQNNTHACWFDLSCDGHRVRWREGKAGQCAGGLIV